MSKARDLSGAPAGNGSLNVDLLSGHNAPYYLDYNNVTNKPVNTSYTKAETDSKYVGAEPLFTSNPYDIGSLSQASSYSSSAPSVVNLGNRTLTFTVVSGSLPTGLSLNSSTGVISGTVGGGITSYSFSIQVSNNAGTNTISGSTTVTAPAPVNDPIGETRAYAGNGMGGATRYAENSYTSSSPVKSFDWRHYYAARYWSSGELYYSLDGSNWISIHSTGTPGNGSWGWTTRTGTISIPSNTSNTIWIRTRATRPDRDGNSAYSDNRGYMTQARFT